MLVLSRKTGEEIVIGENIHIKVVAIHGENSAHRHQRLPKKSLWIARRFTKSARTPSARSQPVPQHRSV